MSKEKKKEKEILKVKGKRKRKTTQTYYLRELDEVSIWLALKYYIKTYPNPTLKEFSKYCKGLYEVNTINFLYWYGFIKDDGQDNDYVRVLCNTNYSIKLKKE